MSQEVIFLILCILIFLIFVGILAYWLYTSSRPYNEDQTMKGYYPEAGLNQRCAVGATGSNITLLLPGYFEPQICGYNLECVTNNPNDIYGICKSIVSGACNTVYDCAPSDLGEVYCSGGVCNLGLTGGLNSACNSDSQCDISKSLVCGPNGSCLYNDGVSCTNNNQCAGGLCYKTSPGDAIGVCISRYSGGSGCTANYCETGFSCVSNYCQPNGPTGATIVAGEKGSFCAIPYYNNPADPINSLVCNSGLVCNFTPQTFNTTVYPDIIGLGLCDIPFTPLTVDCNSNSGACIPPAVCNVIGGVGYCSAPINGGEFDINWCGLGSSSLCENGYTCNTTTYQCLPSLGNMCNGVTGICSSGNCTSYNIGIFTPAKNLSITSGATGSFGTWTYIPLPVGITPNSSTRVSTYQVNTIGSAPYYAPITNSRFVYWDNTMSSTQFYYTEIDIDDNGNITQNSMGWQLIDIQNSSGFTSYGLKFTSGGNFALGNNDGVNNIIYYTSYSNLDLNANTLDFGPPGVNYSFLYLSNDMIDWDIDDVYNMGVVALQAGSPPTFYVADFSSPGVMTNSGSLTFTTAPSWIKYTVNPTNLSYTTNILTNGIRTGDTDQTIYNLEYNSGFTSTVVYVLEQTTNNGIGANFTITNNVKEAEFYYVSDKGFLYSNYVSSININNEPTQVSLVGYPPDFMVTNKTNALSIGNLDCRLYTIVSICQ